jgi:hypothetical protein
MRRITPTVLAVTFVLWALASIVSFSSAPVLAPAAANQINTFELMSTKKDLPVQSYEAF